MVQKPSCSEPGSFFRPLGVFLLLLVPLGLPYFEFSQSPAVEGVPGHFIDATAKLGIHFQDQASPTAEKYLLETMGSGVALFDYDNDGRLDIFFANGARIDYPPDAGTTP